ncbi:hypothetical protein CHCC20442_1664 [Bacillus licheniformis]|nr:hypothetical protein CHCC20442_1664 [Bacillus licheniformis]TWN00960.1 hypothetical protein CHCC14566_0181 [Bacillus licheniformis]
MKMVKRSSKKLMAKEERFMRKRNVGSLIVEEMEIKAYIQV